MEPQTHCNVTQTHCNITSQDSSNASNTRISAPLPPTRENISKHYKFPPGYRFRPSEQALVIDYLGRKVRNQPLPPNNMVEVDLYSYNPSVLAETYKNLGEKEWYFFTSRTRRYPNGSRPNRTASDGYWKANGSDTKVELPDKTVVGCKRSLTFHLGKSPNGIKTSWKMYEFRLNEPPRTKEHDKDMKLDDWILCKIYNTEDSPKQTSLKRKKQTRFDEDGKKGNGQQKNQTQFDKDGNEGNSHMEAYPKSNDDIFNPNSVYVTDNVTNISNQIFPGMAQGYTKEVPNTSQSNTIYNNLTGNLQYNNVASLTAPQDFYSLPQNNTVPVESNHYPGSHYLEDAVRGYNPNSNNNLGSLVNWDNNSEQVTKWDNNRSSIFPSNYHDQEMTLDEMINALMTGVAESSDSHI